jgi:hypothetical protein
MMDEGRGTREERPGTRDEKIAKILVFYHDLSYVALHEEIHLELPYHQRDFFANDLDDLVSSP